MADLNLPGVVNGSDVTLSDSDKISLINQIYSVTYDPAVSLFKFKTANKKLYSAVNELKQQTDEFNIKLIEMGNVLTNGVGDLKSTSKYKEDLDKIFSNADLTKIVLYIYKLIVQDVEYATDVPVDPQLLDKINIIDGGTF